DGFRGVLEGDGFRGVLESDRLDGVLDGSDGFGSIAQRLEGALDLRGVERACRGFEFLDSPINVVNDFVFRWVVGHVNLLRFWAQTGAKGRAMPRRLENAPPGKSSISCCISLERTQRRSQERSPRLECTTSGSSS